MTAKDMTAYSLIYGVSGAAQALLIGGALAADIITRGAARNMSRLASEGMRPYKKAAIEYYKRSGDIVGALEELWPFI